VPVGFLRAEVVTWAPSPQQFAGSAAVWFTQVLEGLFPAFDQRLKAGPSLPFDHVKDPSAPMGPPGGAHGMIKVRTRSSRAGESWKRYTDSTWQRTLESLARSVPHQIQLTAEALDHRGLLVSPMENIVVGVRRLPDDSGWACLQVQAARGDRGEPDAARPYPDHDQRRWAEFIKEQAARFDACYAHVTDDPVNGGGTALENATGQRPDATVPRCREVLRGYSWVTVCAAELSARLGGPAALGRSGAFDEVTELAGGQVFLRATPFIQDYLGEILARVFETLAPVLLTGRPNPMSPVTESGRLVKDADAADYQ
jgi:hypothetical protein